MEAVPVTSCGICGVNRVDVTPGDFKFSVILENSHDSSSNKEGFLYLDLEFMCNGEIIPNENASNTYTYNIDQSQCCLDIPNKYWSSESSQEVNLDMESGYPKLSSTSEGSSIFTLKFKMASQIFMTQQYLIGLTQCHHHPRFLIQRAIKIWEW